MTTGMATLRCGATSELKTNKVRGIAPPTFYVTDRAMNDMENILAILDDETPTHIVDAIVCELFK